MTIAFLKGHAMKRGTLMVLKRLFVTTLGALGLGALAAGPASAQQIPAPDLFDDQVACSSNVPSGMANAAVGMALGMTIMDGDSIVVNTDAMGSVSFGGMVAGLNYIIPPGDSNCGAGTYTQAEVTALDEAADDGDSGIEVGDPKPVTGAVAKDVATGYSDTLTAYLALRVEDAAVKAANTALSTLLTDDIGDDLQTATISAARETLAAAQLKQGVAQRALSAVGTGPINKLGIAEWQAKFAVEDAVTAWNTAVTDLNTAETNLDPLDYAAYVPLRDIAQIDGLVDQDGNVNLVNLRKYANANGDNSAVQDDETGDITDGPGSTGTGNFDAAGNLLVPMSLQDHDDDSDTEMRLRPTPNSMTYMQINDRLTSVSETVAALKKFKGDNKNALLTAAIDAAIQRAETEQAYYEGQFAAMVSDTTDLDTDRDGDATTMPDSLRARYSKYTAARTVRDNAGVDLELKFEARETATSAVADGFTNPQAFYQQLVDRREYRKAQDEAEVTRLAGLTGDDAPSDADTEAAAEAVTAAEKALTAATDAQAAFQELVAEGSPVKELVEELLRGDAVGDDGGKLVDAIAATYEGSAANEERLDALLAETVTETETMTPVVDADGNPVLDDDGNPMMEATTTTTTTESGRIVTIESRIDDLFGAGDDDDDGTAGVIAGLQTDVGENEAEIDENEGRLDTLLTTTEGTDAEGNSTTTESGRIVEIETNLEAVDGTSVSNETRLDALLAETVTETETMTPVVDADGNPVLDADGNPMMETTTTTTTTESGRIVDIETSVGAGDAATLAAAGEAADAGDAATLAAAGEAADAGDAATLAAAGEAADAGDAATLAAAGEAADAGDAATLAAAGEAADAGDAATLAAAGEAADAGDAATLAAAGEAADAGDAATLAAAGEAADAGDAATLAAAGEAADAGDAAEAAKPT